MVAPEQNRERKVRTLSPIYRGARQSLTATGTSGARKERTAVLFSLLLRGHGKCNRKYTANPLLRSGGKVEIVR